MDPADAWLAPAALGPRVDGRDPRRRLARDPRPAARGGPGRWGRRVPGRRADHPWPRAAGPGAGRRCRRRGGDRGREPPAGAAPRATPAPPRRPAGRVSGDASAGAAPVARGLVIAVPVVAVFVALFASADAVFARLTSDVLAWQPDVDLEDLLVRAVVVTVVAWGAAGLLGLAAGLLPAYVAVARATMRPEPRPTQARASRRPRPRPPARPRTSTPTVAASPGPPLPPVPVGPRRPAGPGADLRPRTRPWPGPPVARPEDRPPLRLGTTEAATILVVVDVLFAAFVGPAARLPLRRHRHDGHGRAHLRGVRPPRVLRAGARRRAGRAARRDAGPRRGARGRAASWPARSCCWRSRPSCSSRPSPGSRLYQSMYGWTELRLVVLVAIAWLAVALAVTAGLLAGASNPLDAARPRDHGPRGGRRHERRSARRRS